MGYHFLHFFFKLNILSPVSRTPLISQTKIILNTNLPEQRLLLNKWVIPCQLTYFFGLHQEFSQKLSYIVTNMLYCLSVRYKQNGPKQSSECPILKKLGSKWCLHIQINSNLLKFFITARLYLHDNYF